MGLVLSAVHSFAFSVVGRPYRTENLFGQPQPSLREVKEPDLATLIRSALRDLRATSGIQPVTRRNFTGRHITSRIPTPPTSPNGNLWFPAGQDKEGRHQTGASLFEAKNSDALLSTSAMRRISDSCQTSRYFRDGPISDMKAPLTRSPGRRAARSLRES
jgi:hypothetical protein